MKLRSLLVLVVGLVLAAGLLVLSVLFQSGLRTYSASTSEEAVHVRTEALGVFLSRSLFEEWQRVERAAERLSGSFDPALADATIAGLEQDIDKVSWIGIADPGALCAFPRSDGHQASKPWQLPGEAMLLENQFDSELGPHLAKRAAHNRR
jgi:hypothetical protein